MIGIVSLILNIIAILLGALDLVIRVRRRFKKRKEDTRSGDAEAARCDIRRENAFWRDAARVKYRVVRF